MRSISSIKNAVVSILMSVVTVLIGLISQKIFIGVLGTEYLGLNGLFSNIISMLSIAELGIGSAIIYSLYEPIAHGKKEEIKTLMQFYKKSYRIITLIITILGICFIPFLNIIVGQNSIKENILLIYLLFLLDTIVSYLLTYKRSILYADQKNYIINLVHIAYLIIMNIFQIIILITTKNYIIYLIIKVICRILENVVITVISNNKYPYIKEKNVINIKKENKNAIIKRVKGLIFHKVGGFIVLGSDNIIMSIFLGVNTVGIYSNYDMIIKAIKNLFSQIFSSITASVGNLLVENDNNKSYKIYKNMLFVNSWLYSFATISVIFLIQPFIETWLGKQYLLSNSVALILGINFYIQGMRSTPNTFKEAAGIYHEDRYVPIFESIINVIASIVFLNIWGLEGIFLGTIASTLILFLYSYPKFVYKKIFNRGYIQFLKEISKYFILFIIITIMTIYIISKCKIDNSLIQLIVNSIIVIIIPNLIYLVLFYKTEEFKYLKNMIFKIARRNK